jgi:RNA polymerase sigma-70 factor (ECF subfamily)
LQLFESGNKDAPGCAEVAPILGLSESGLRSAVHRMRQRYGELVREEIAHTASSPAEVNEEIHCLLHGITG